MTQTAATPGDALAFSGIILAGVVALIAWIWRKAI